MTENFESKDNFYLAHKLKEANDFYSYKELLELANSNLWVVKQQILRFGNMVLSASEVQNRNEEESAWYRIGVANTSAACTVDVQPMFASDINDGLVFVRIFNGQIGTVSDNITVLHNQREDHSRTLTQYHIPEAYNLAI